MTWTRERIAALRTLWTAGRTAAQIAATLGGLTRNAVIGKANRLSLPALSAAPLIYPGTIDLAAHHCRWPEGDPKKPGFHFCGRPMDRTSSYCAHHHARAVDSKGLRTKVRAPLEESARHGGGRESPPLRP